MGIATRQRRLSETCFDRKRPGSELDQARLPKGKASRRDGERDFHTQPVTIPTRSRLGPRKKSQISSGMAFSVSIKQMIGAGVILIHASLNQTHAEDAGIKVV